MRKMLCLLGAVFLRISLPVTGMPGEMNETKVLVPVMKTVKTELNRPGSLTPFSHDFYLIAWLVISFLGMI
ncbi:hypothetical protein [Halomonas alkalicola]|uniref:hypothetical protein n=1 Tax=Halomonas alkalicola TaxID=1930622 RepID=UPI00265F0FFE|nr:hypothetical protein [Halomonas alkalicola]